MNPILPLHHFVPDVEARQWDDGRLYLYGSYDVAGDNTYCSDEYRVFSSADMVQWQDHGTSFRSAVAHSGKDQALYAPDAVKTGDRYHLFYCLANNAEGVASSKTPFGPFENAHGIAGADGDAIDPAVLVDDDGQVYYFGGQYQLRGARLLPGLNAIDQTTFQPALLDEAKHGFHEGASIRKHNGLYYMVYTDVSRGRATSLGYAVSRSPLGPYEKHGIIIDNTGCDRETWNNHGSIAEFNGRWFVFYHRSSQASRYNRRVCVEPITFDASGDIAEVEMTPQGISGPIPATDTLEACRACLLSGNVRTEAVGLTETNHQPSEHLTLIGDGDWAAYKYLNFASGVYQFTVRAGSLGKGGTIELRLEQPTGELIGVCEITPTGGWQKWQQFTGEVRVQTTSTQALYLVFKGGPGRLFDLKYFSFSNK